MDSEKYYEISNEKNLPARCPILSYCSRRADTIYIFSEYNRYYPNENAIDLLKKNGVLPEDFRKKQIHIQGEAPYMIRGNSSSYFADMCPEVNLFDGMNALYPKTACVEASYDDHRQEKSKIMKCQHYSECPEFNYYLFHHKLKVRTKKKRKNVSLKVRAILQKEIYSNCPFCQNSDVGHFHVHHIDEDPENNDLINLLMICPTCHSKITKRDISKEEVEKVKFNLSSKKNE